ncbi:MAG: ABC transporter ATP-binding protein [Patescibacteria group bacterium]|nr:ABC transporter ATP-binding protein [Patescibacteria group bacterium]MDD4304562.1 ABC transporter ATP-binding protein [Patescibacteria group bacterium]MDD4695749.1 ABC transporter ATP-binding protein [Patescibacteria group bacterium]
MLLTIKNISKEYENGEATTKVLCDVSFNIEKGEFVSIMGPSGSGKSTLMHILGLLDRQTSGTYLFEGEDVSKLNDNELANFRNEKIGFVFQAFHLLPKTTVLENVMLPLIYSKDKKNHEAKAKKILEDVGLSHRINHFTNQISGGEKQRVAIARALVNNPDVLFADEPTGNLDSKSGKQIMEILQELNNMGHTIILVTHETSTAEHADRIIKIIDGEIVEDYAVKDKKIAKNEIGIK